MSETIWKYPLTIEDIQYMTMPIGARPLHVDVQDGNLTLWMQVDPEQRFESRDVLVVGTGNPIPNHLDKLIHCGSAIMGPFVWHVFIAEGQSVD